MAQTDISQIAIGIGQTERYATIYAPLAPHETRFLTIFPASNMDDNIVSELKYVSLGENAIDDYEALSYTWESQNCTRTISVNGFPLNITTNLLDAIRYLRDKEKNRTLWIDAICINQSDLAERSSQVLNMKQIFSAVSQVIIWLGREENITTSVMALPLTNMTKMNPNQVRAASARIFDRQWWFRTWTIQEFLHAKSHVFVCGSLMLSWIEVKELLAENQTMDLAYNHIYNFVRSKNNRKNDTLKTMLSDFGHSQATDPRDKVFALLGIASDSHEFVPDYETSVQKVYTDVVEMHIKKYHSLDIIGLHHRGYSGLDLPSWVPDWSLSRKSTHNWTANMNAKPLYSAGFKNKNDKRLTSCSGHVDPAVTRFVGFTTLSTVGVYVGAILDMTSSIDPALFETNDWMRELSSWKPTDIEFGNYLGVETNFRAFCRTLVANVSGSVSYTIFDEKDRETRLETLESKFREIFSGFIDEYLIPKRRLKTSLYLSCFARLSSGHMALVPKASKKGDHICVLRGCSVPMGLRISQLPLSLTMNSTPNINTTYRMIGPCYVHGVMDGELFEKIDSSFVIV